MAGKISRDGGAGVAVIPAGLEFRAREEKRNSGRAKIGMRVLGICLGAGILISCGGGSREAGGAPGPRLQVRGKLVELTPVPEVEEIAPYRRALVTYVYVVEDVRGGELREPKIAVTHWAILEGSKVEGYPRELGRSYELELEEFRAHPELKSAHRLDGTEGFDLGLWHDVGDGE